jgi:hypothetical protein
MSGLHLYRTSSAHHPWPVFAHTPPEPDLPEDPDRDKDLPDVNPGSNPENPGDQPNVREPGKPPDVVADARGVDAV